MGRDLVRKCRWTLSCANAAEHGQCANAAEYYLCANAAEHNLCANAAEHFLCAKAANFLCAQVAGNEPAFPPEHEPDARIPAGGIQLGWVATRASGTPPHLPRASLPNKITNIYLINTSSSQRWLFSFRISDEVLKRKYLERIVQL